jgi:chromosome segregation ATPase
MGGSSGTGNSGGADIDDKQIENLQEELENSKCKILSKDSSISLLKNRIEAKDQESNQLRSQIEKLNRSIKDLTSSNRSTIRFNEEKISKKQRELETILKDKKCKNCPICLEGMNHNF